jgi:nucleoside 2-deoxyribosyltransferase
MKIFLAGTFQDKEDESMLKRVFDLLTREGHSVWWAPAKVGRGYESQDGDRMERIIATEEKAIEENDLFLAIMKKATFGTAMEIKHAFEHKKTIIAYLLSDSPDFNSVAFRLRVKNIVRNDEELLDCLKN